jgi:hypothetical protein
MIGIDSLREGVCMTSVWLFLSCSIVLYFSHSVAHVFQYKNIITKFSLVNSRVLKVYLAIILRTSSLIL